MMNDGQINKVTAPMVGKIIQVKVKPGDTVSANQSMITFESMKIEMEIMAPVAGKVKEVLVSAGQVIEAEQTLATIEA